MYVVPCRVSCHVPSGPMAISSSFFEKHTQLRTYDKIFNNHQLNPSFLSFSNSEKTKPARIASQSVQSFKRFSFLCFEKHFFSLQSPNTLSLSLHGETGVGKRKEKKTAEGQGEGGAVRSQAHVSVGTRYETSRSAGQSGPTSSTSRRFKRTAEISRYARRNARTRHQTLQSSSRHECRQQAIQSHSLGHVS